MDRVTLLAVLLLGLALVAAGEEVQAQAAPAPPAVAAGRLDGRLTLDGALAEPAWAKAGTIPDLVQQEPEPGAPTPYATRVQVLADDTHLYLGITAADPEPDRISVHTLQRDTDLEGDDTIGLVLDTFGDGRTGYLFRINAGGARQDGLISGPEDSSLDWDGIWDARTRRTAAGWTAEIVISIQSLRFKPGLASWGMNLERYIARDRITLRWAGLTLDSRLADLRRAGRLEGCAGLRQGLGLSVAPYGLGRLEDRRGKDGPGKTGDFGLDLSYNLTPSLGAVLTVNTDFAETEVDTRQINLTRFLLFFPEKRPFFLEGSNLFAFGTGLGTDFIPFYSRRVGLVSGRTVPIDAGLKVLGRAGPWSIAALDVETGESPAAPAANLFAGRATYDLDEHLRVGTVVTHGDPTGESRNTLAGLDAVWQTAAFHGDKNLAFGAWSAQSRGDLAPGQRSGWGFKADYPNDLWDLSFVLNEFGEALDPALGFLPRPGTRQINAGAAYQPRPSPEGAFSWVRQFFFELFPSRVERLDGTVESWRVFTAPFNVSTQSGEHLEANWAPQFERLDEPFEIARGIFIPAGEYRFDRFRVEGQSSRARPWRVGSTVWFGDFFGGRLTQWESFLYWTFGPGRVRIELDAENDFGNLPQGRFIQRLWQLKTVYAASPNLNASVFTQYDSESHDLGLNSRLRWTLQPGRDLFVVWNRNWKRRLDPRDRLERESDQVVIKLRWTMLW